MLAVSSLILLLVPYLGVISRDLAIRLLLLFTLLPVISLPRWSLSCSNGTNSFLSVKLESISVDLSKALLLNLEFLNVELASAFYIQNYISFQSFHQLILRGSLVWVFLSLHQGAWQLGIIVLRPTVALLVNVFIQIRLFFKGRSNWVGTFALLQFEVNWVCKLKILVDLSNLGLEFFQIFVNGGLCFGGSLILMIGGENTGLEGDIMLTFFLVDNVLNSAYFLHEITDQPLNVVLQAPIDGFEFPYPFPAQKQILLVVPFPVEHRFNLFLQEYVMLPQVAVLGKHHCFHFFEMILVGQN